MSLDSIRDQARALCEEGYASIDWIDPGGTGESAIGETPAIPDWMLGMVIKREFGDLITYDPTDDRRTVDPKVAQRVADLTVDITTLLMQGHARANAGARSLPPKEQEAVGAVSMLHATAVRPNFEDLNEEQRVQMEFFQSVQVVSHWFTQVLTQRARELRLEERTRG